ncbi:MAG: SDR family oxidoreductase, partial [Desulfobacula sp.]|nr:SDR family oxidoreductase [Desulfobacula sp.]
MDKNLKGKIALVTGSGKKTGIGYAIAKKIASQGCHIIIADYGNNKSLDADIKTGSMDEMEIIGDELHQEYGVDILAVNVDVTNM